jgi:hypothetical protein
MITGWPDRSVSFCPTMRASVSVDPPGENGTTIRTGRVGYSWAGLVPVARDATSNNATREMSPMRLSMRNSKAGGIDFAIVHPL